MTSSEQVREEVAAVLDSVFGVEFSRPYEDVLRDGVDTILARWPVLAGVTDEVVEAGARALRSRINLCGDDPACECEHAHRVSTEAARAVLSAALGPRPGDGSATDA